MKKNKVYPIYDKNGNLEMTEKIWTKLSWWDRFKLVFILQYHGKAMVKKIEEEK